MLQTIESINNDVNNFIWGVPAMICIIGVGLYLSLRTGFVQIRKFPYALKTTLGRIFKKKEASDGSMTPFQAVCTALAGTVGTGNIAGVAGAIAIGGPGAVFWMWVSALLGMFSKFSEVTLAVHFRERNRHGDYVGGPMYYIKNGLGKNWRFLAVLYSAFGVLTVFGTGNATQVNTITTAIDTALINFNVISESSTGRLNLILGIVITLLVGMVLLGGIKRIGSVSEKLVPFMALFYIVLALGVVILNIGRVPAVFHVIVYGAFNPSAVTGGVIGSFFLSMKKGVSRGIFSNEAGLGTGSIAHACADTSKTVNEALAAQIAVIGENMNIRRFQQVKEENGFVASYTHMGGKIGVLVDVETDVVNDDLKEMAKNVAMQIAALKPQYTSDSEVSAEYIEHEKEILMAQIQNDPKESQKPEKVIQGMIAGRIKKEMKEICLLDQVYVKAEDGKQSVAAYVAQVAKANNVLDVVKGFVRIETADGIEP